MVGGLGHRASFTQGLDAKAQTRVSEEAWLMHSTSEIPEAYRSISPPCGPRAKNSEQTQPQCHSQLAVVF